MDIENFRLDNYWLKITVIKCLIQSCYPDTNIHKLKLLLYTWTTRLTSIIATIYTLCLLQITHKSLLQQPEYIKN